MKRVTSGLPTTQESGGDKPVLSGLAIRELTLEPYPRVQFIGCKVEV